MQILLISLGQPWDKEATASIASTPKRAYLGPAEQFPNFANWTLNNGITSAAMAPKNLQNSAYKMATKKPEPVLQVHYQELQRYDAFSCVFKAGHDTGQAVSSLAYAKTAFNSVAFLHVLVCGFLLWFIIASWTTQRRSAQPDTVFPAERKVFPGAI